MTREGASPRGRAPRAPRDPYGIGPVSGMVGPFLAILALVVVAAVTISLANGNIPFLKTSAQGGNQPGGNGNGPTPSPAPSNVVITEPDSIFPGSIVYAKAGNIWIQTGTEAHQITNTGTDAMPTFSADGQWIYFIRVTRTRGTFPTAGFQAPAYYDLDTPTLIRIKPDGSGAQRLLTGSFSKPGGYRWYYWLRQPVPSPDGKSVIVVSDGPNPLQSDVTLHSFGLATKKLTSLGLPESLQLGHQDPAWRPDGRFLLYVMNGRQATSGAPRIYRYDATTKRTRVLTGPGYLAPSYSPDGRWISATKTDAFGTDVVILDQNGNEVLRVTDDAHSFSPIWSPAGNAVAFLHLEGTIVDLRMAKLDDATGNWVVTSTVDLTKVSDLDGASRPSWYIPPADIPAASGAPAAGGSPSGSTTP